MDPLQTALFENPLGIYIALAIVAAMGLVSYQNWRTFKSLWPTVIALIAGAVVFTISTLIVTDREQIRDNCEKIVRAVNNRNMLIVEYFFDRDFAGEGRYETRKKTIARLARDLEEYRVKGVEYQILKLNAKSDLAIMVVRSDVTSETIPVMRLNWSVVWIKRSKGWLVYKVKGPLTEPAAEEDSE